MSGERPWSAGEQARLLAGLRSGEPPQRLCRELDRDPADVRSHIASLFGDAPPSGADTGAALADLDLLWLRVRLGSVAPASPSPETVVGLWESATGMPLSPRQRAAFELDPAVARLAEQGRHALLATATDLVRDTGMLDLDDWLAAATHEDVGLRFPIPDTVASPAWAPAMVRLLRATVDDVAPASGRAALRRHFGFDEDTRAGAEAASRRRRRGVIEVLRAAGVAGRPAALLRDRLLGSPAVRALTRALPGSLGVATTLGVLGGRHEVDALRLAGRNLTPWHEPPNLGRGAVVRIRS